MPYNKTLYTEHLIGAVIPALLIYSILITFTASYSKTTFFPPEIQTTYYIVFWTENADYGPKSCVLYEQTGLELGRDKSGIFPLQRRTLHILF